MLEPKWLLLLSAPCLALAGCITSPPGAYGATAEAREMKLKSCPGGLLDDCEDNDNQIIETEGRGGYWFTFADEEGSTIDPRGDFVMTTGGAQGSKHSARMRGTMASAGESLYVGMGFSLTNPKGPYDASKYQGVSFWAKGPGKVRFKTPDINTIPEGDRCKDCYNDFGVDLYLTAEYKLTDSAFRLPAEDHVGV